MILQRLECVYVKYKNHASTARELPDYYLVFLPVKALLLIASGMAFYAIIEIQRLLNILALYRLMHLLS